MVSEMAESISLTSFSSRFIAQVISDWLYDFLLNFTYCNATQRFTRCICGQKEIKRPAMPFIKPSFLYGTHELNAAYSFLAEVDGCYFGLPHMQALVKLVGPHSLPLLIQACLQHLTHLVTSVLPSHMMELLPRMPEDLAMPPLNSAPLGCLNFFDQQVEWLKQYNRRVDLLECLRLIGSIIAWMVFMDMALREQDTLQMMQVAPFLGVISGRDGQLQHLVGDDDDQTGPLVSLIQRALTTAMEKDAVVVPALVPDFIKNAQITESMYWSSVQASSVLKYAISHLKMSLDCVRRHWAPAPTNGLLETRPMQDFCSLYSALQFIFCLDQPEPGQETHWEKYGDALSWGACSIIYLLGQRRRFEMVDFSCYLMRVVETDTAVTSLAALRERVKGRSTTTLPALGRSKELKLFLANAVKAYRVNSFVMNMLAAHHPFEQKPAQALAHDGSVLTGVTHELKPSGFELLPHLTARSIANGAGQ
ncbi:hypothetical protein CBR_g23326 [Chara braunii]|uniref:Uncharacterized protein n=1 Tax=Chara braunii TaxID=69332 RepID=A0A388L3V9_CHABU|nr:hypothetical protein CBR_g23326 [Chara braunii]|eukprot:GBG76995.1 hypothetical protein CBR_g23326 [Chara braunii]